MGRGYIKHCEDHDEDYNSKHGCPWCNDEHNAEVEQQRREAREEMEAPFIELVNRIEKLASAKAAQITAPYIFAGQSKDKAKELAVQQAAQVEEAKEELRDHLILHWGEPV